MHPDFQKTIHAEWLALLWQNDQQITQLDPLNADELLQNLPVFNAENDTVALVDLLRWLLPSPAVARAMSCEEACAAMRDIGIMLGSLKKHGIEPEEAVPALSVVLPLLGSISNFPPRDTLLHYTIWNPADDRMRTYTGTEDEKNLIRSVQMAIPPLEMALQSLMQLCGQPIHSDDFHQLSKKVSSSLEGLIEGVVYARRNVSTLYFAQEMRLYYDPIRLNGETYLGPGAVEMPVFVFDHLFWSADCTDAEYTAFKKSYLPYVRPIWRTVYEAYAHQPSLVSHLQAALDAGTCLHPIAALKEIVTISNRLKSFRMPHRKLAEEAYAHQSGGHRNHGSGGYEPDILLRIINLMTDKTDRLLHAYQDLQKQMKENEE